MIVDRLWLPPVSQLPEKLAKWEMEIAMKRMHTVMTKTRFPTLNIAGHNSKARLNQVKITASTIVVDHLLVNLNKTTGKSKHEA